MEFVTSLIFADHDADYRLPVFERVSMFDSVVDDREVNFGEVLLLSCEFSTFGGIFMTEGVGANMA